jgi:hypothetical protein
MVRYERIMIFPINMIFPLNSLRFDKYNMDEPETESQNTFESASLSES